MKKLIAMLLMVVSSLNAITIDQFNGPQSLISNQPSMVTMDTYVSDTILGGTRFVRVESNTIGSTYVDIDNTFFNHSQTSNNRGDSLVIYDGNTNPGLDDVTGLGGVNLKADSGTSFILHVFSYDGAGDGRLELTVYDASGGGNTWAKSSFTFNRSIFGEDLTFPFSSFVEAGFGQTDFSNIGAIKVDFIGYESAIDLTLTDFKTNGYCPQVPNTHVIVDECGVCGGDNSTCIDCSGVPNGDAEYDDCGVCGGDGSTCEDCAGIPNGITEVDECGVCGGDNTSCCSSVNQEDTIRTLDHLTASLFIIAKNVSNHIKRATKKRKLKRYAKAMRAEADKLYERAWQAAWTIPTEVLSCPTRTSCVQTDYTIAKEELRTRANSLYVLIKKGFKKLKTARGGKLTKRQKKLIVRAKKRLVAGENNINNLVVRVDVCN